MSVEARCPECGSVDLIRSATLGADLGWRGLLLWLYEKPKAKFFVGRIGKHEIRANVCCQCGFVKLLVEQPQHLREFPREQRSEF